VQVLRLEATVASSHSIGSQRDSREFVHCLEFGHVSAIMLRAVYPIDCTQKMEGLRFHPIRTVHEKGKERWGGRGVSGGVEERRPERAGEGENRHLISGTLRCPLS
jgi:hypothetical protein